MKSKIKKNIKIKYQKPLRRTKTRNLTNNENLLRSYYEGKYIIYY